MIDWLNLGVIIMQGALLGLVFYGMRRTQRIRDVISADLAEMQRCNTEFAEAVLLANYGATEEAIEMARRWEQRA